MTTLKKVVPSALITAVAAFVATVVIVIWRSSLVVEFGPDPSVSCQRQLKSIGHAISLYSTEYGAVPPAVFDENGKPKHSWRALVLPFLLLPNSPRGYAYIEPWNSPGNLTFSNEVQSVYQCERVSFKRPQKGAVCANATEFFMVVLPEGLCTDGVYPFVIVEGRASDFTWTTPRDYSWEELLSMLREARRTGRCDKLELHDFHDGTHGFHVRYPDGDIAFIEFTEDAIDACLRHLGVE